MGRHFAIYYQEIYSLRPRILPIYCNLMNIHDHVNLVPRFVDINTRNWYGRFLRDRYNQLVQEVPNANWLARTRITQCCWLELRLAISARNYRDLTASRIEEDFQIRDCLNETLNSLGLLHVENDELLVIPQGIGTPLGHGPR